MPALVSQKKTRSVTSVICVLDCLTGRLSGRLVVQKLRTGHSLQSGDVGRQMVWPSSMIAELNSRGDREARTS